MRFLCLLIFALMAPTLYAQDNDTPTTPPLVIAYAEVAPKAREISAELDTLKATLLAQAAQIEAFQRRVDLLAVQAENPPSTTELTPEWKSAGALLIHGEAVAREGITAYRRLIGRMNIERELLILYAAEAREP